MSAKEEELLKEVSSYLHGYLKAGTLKINSFIEKAHLNIHNLEQLLIIRFLLRNETKDYVRNLPHLLNRFKTTTVVQTEITEAEIRGQINWPETSKFRMSRNPRDRMHYVTEENQRSYDVIENLVLKELLQTLHDILFEKEYMKGLEEAEWFQDWQDLKGHLHHALKENVYMLRVRHKVVSERSLINVQAHRNPLYSGAAQLLLLYRSLLNGNYNQEDIQTILQQTFITPSNQDVLFELYWIVQIVKHNTKNSRLYLIDGTRNKVASWEEDDLSYHLYHDSAGSNQIQFKVGLDEIRDSNNPYLELTYLAHRETNKLIQSIFGKAKNQHVWRGRPDFLIEIYDLKSNELVKVIIGEIKNTSSVDYAMTGLKELVTYMHLVKNNKQEYLYDGDINVLGVLCVDHMSFNQSNELDEVKVVARGDILKI
ncbi:hypothetical protein MKX54_19770 [Alkalihalobacillus sp. FSL R5-0424]